MGRHSGPTYQRRHRHMLALLANSRVREPEATAHVFLGAFDADLVRPLCPDGRPDRLAETVRDLATALLPAAHPTDE
ncbi:hypothetical protein AB5J56_36145 [Streptomyces sp. R21]|uniref:TetR family transcriptional regulator n=1 Tax=Streptomyces sp. R21 TaxID=3238627 RepID=A0AB39PIW8_9ACTN